MFYTWAIQAKILLHTMLVIYHCTKSGKQCCHIVKILVLDGQLPPQWALATAHIGSKVGRSLFSRQLLLPHCHLPPHSCIPRSTIKMSHSS